MSISATLLPSAAELAQMTHYSPKISGSYIERVGDSIKEVLIDGEYGCTKR
jgi:hypothetical protein